MELEAVIQKRKSVRTFKQDDISDEFLKEIIDLARKSPSAGAIRGYEAIITREKINRIDAPVYLVVCANPEAYEKRYGDRGRNLYSVQDATIFGAYLQLILVDRGLASVWIGAFRESKVKQTLGLEGDLRPIAIIAAGYEPNL